MPEENQADVEANLRALGEQADASADDTVDSSPAPAPDNEPSTDAPEDQEDAPEPTKSADTPAEAKPQEQEEKPKSNYEKAKERQQKQWDEIRETKEQLRKQQAEIEQRQREFEDRQRQAEPQDDTPPEAYENHAKTLRQQADEARRIEYDDNKAAELERQAVAAEQYAGNLRQRNATEQQRFAEEWNRVQWDEIGKSPEFKDKESPHGKAVQAVLQAQPWLFRHPEGFRYAASQAKQQLAAAEVPALKSKIADLTKENERLVKLTSVGGSKPVTRQAVPSDTDFSGPGGGQRLRAMAAEHDAALARD